MVSLCKEIVGAELFFFIEKKLTFLSELFRNNFLLFKADQLD